MTTTSQSAPPTISAHDASKVLGVVPATIYAWVRADEIPHLRLGGRIRIPTAKLAEMLGLTAEDIAKAL